MIHLSEKRLLDFLCWRDGAFDAQMHAWLQCIGRDDEAAWRIHEQTGYLPPAVQLAQHCAEQALKEHMTEHPGFAEAFLQLAQQAQASLSSRCFGQWLQTPIDLARALASLQEANTAMSEMGVTTQVVPVPSAHERCESFAGRRQ